MAGRSAKHGAWAGDVYKIVDTLRTLRPDLTVLEMDTEPTGTLVVMNTDPHNRVLDEAYDQLVVDYVVPDPQVVPNWALQQPGRQGGGALASPVWAEIRRLRSLPDAEARPPSRGHPSSRPRRHAGV